MLPPALVMTTHNKSQSLSKCLKRRSELSQSQTQAYSLAVKMLSESCVYYQVREVEYSSKQQKRSEGQYRGKDIGASIVHVEESGENTPSVLAHSSA